MICSDSDGGPTLRLRQVRRDGRQRMSFAIVFDRWLFELTSLFSNAFLFQDYLLRISTVSIWPRRAEEAEEFGRDVIGDGQLEVRILTV